MAVPYSRMCLGILPWYSVLIVLGIVLAIVIASREAARKGLAKDLFLDIALYALPLGIIGARLYYVLFRWEEYAAKPLSVLYIWEGGLAIYGAVIGGALGVFLFSRRRKLSFRLIADCIAPGLILAQAIGRWGNYFNQEAYGPLVQLAQLQFFPLCVKIGSEWLMATFFYESLWNLIVFFMLMILRKKTRKSGDLFLLYLLLYGSGRFVIEQLRQDSLYWLGLRASQWLSLALCLAAAILLMRDEKPLLRRLLNGLLSLLLINRWFLTGCPWGYGIVSLCSLALLLWLKKSRASIANLLLTALSAVLADALTLYCMIQQPFPMAELSQLLTQLLCSMSLCCCQLQAYHSANSNSTEVSHAG